MSTLSGWRRNALAFFLGICATLTLAPFFLFPFIIPAFTGLYVLINNAPSRKRVFLDGWWWGWGFYISGLYWFCIALLTDAEHFAWLIPFALFGITGVIAIYCGVACWLTSLLTSPSPLVGEGGMGGNSPRVQASNAKHHSPLPNPPPQGGRESSKIFLFSLVWTCVEYARGYLFTGFPWNLEGYSFGFSNISLQMASLVGVYGLTFFAVLLGTSFAAIREKYFLAAVWGLFVIGMGWGAWRLHEADLIPESERTVPGVTLRLVQANISQPHKWDPRLRRQGLSKYMRLTNSPGIEKATHILWPETAVPYAIETGSPLARDLGANIPEGKILITGALRISPVSREAAQDPALGSAPQDLNFQIWNSMVALDHGGNIVGSYDKSRLVPFGEFLPFRSLLPKAWLTPVGDRDFSRGPGARTLEILGLPPISPLICYEVIFPASIADPQHRPQLLLNITNDAWFGMSSGPYQHFEMARMRAVEQGIPLVRVANTGISASVDSYGRVIAALGLGEEGVLNIQLQKPQPHDTTFTRVKNLFLLLMIFFGIFLILKQQKKEKD